MQFACGKFCVPSERSRHLRERRFLAEVQLLLNEPIHIRRQCRPKCPGMSRIERVHLANARCLQRFADRFKKLFSMLFNQRFEEGHSQHFALAFINARRKKFVHIVAKEMTMQKTASPMGFHE